MTAEERFKKRLLRGVLEENLEVLEGQPLGSRRRQRAHRLTRFRTAATLMLAVLGVAAGSGAWFILKPVDDRSDSSPTATASIRLANPVAAIDPDPPSPVRLAHALASGEARPLVGELIPLAVRRVVVDPGHGGIDGGTTLGNGMMEKDITFDIGLRVENLLSDAGCEVIRTRTDDVAVSLKDRVRIANGNHADLFLSIHVNWLPDRTARGIETYYLGTTDDPFLRQLAALENQDSGYSVSDTRRLLEGIYADVRQSQSRQLAVGIQSALFQTLKQDNPQIDDRGVMQAPFVVLVATEMPAILAEVACISNEREAHLLATPSYRQRIAEALVEGVFAYAESIGPVGPGTSAHGG